MLDVEDNSVLNYEVITEIKELNDKYYYTVARIISDTHCVELHYNKLYSYVEIGTKVNDTDWESIVEKIDWFNKNISMDEVFNQLEKIYKDNFRVRKIENNKEKQPRLYEER